MKRFLKLVFTYFSLLIGVQWLLGLGLDTLHQRATYFKPSRIRNDVQWRKADWLIVGSSRALTSFNSAEISAVTGKKTINISVHDTGPEIHRLLIALAIEGGYRPEKILLQYDLTAQETKPREQLHEMDYLFLPLLTNSDVVHEYFLHKMGKSFVVAQYIFPIWKYAYFNTELLFPLPLMLTQPTKTYRSNANGDYDYPTSGSALPPCDKPFISQTALVKDSALFAYLDSLASDFDIQITVVTAPFYGFKTTFAGFPNYLNASDWFNCQSAYFYDEIHLNSKGKAAFTAQLLEVFEAAD